LAIFFVFIFLHIAITGNLTTILFWGGHSCMVETLLSNWLLSTMTTMMVTSMRWCKYAKEWQRVNQMCICIQRAYVRRELLLSQSLCWLLSRLTLLTSLL
jgi:hypothetical protein